MNPLRASWKGLDMNGTMGERSRKRSNIRNSRIRKGRTSAPHVILSRYTCFSQISILIGSCFSLFCPEDLLNAPKTQITEHHDLWTQLHLCACILSTRCMFWVQVSLHVGRMLLLLTPSCRPDMANRSQISPLAPLDFLTFNNHYNQLEWALLMKPTCHSRPDSAQNKKTVK